MIDIEKILLSEFQLNNTYIEFSFFQKNWRGKMLSIQNVCLSDVPTLVPHVPVYIRGSIDIAGDMAPVMDIHQYCGLSPRELSTKKVAVMTFEEEAQEKLIRSITESLASENDEKEQKKNEINLSSDAFIGISIIYDQLVVLMDADYLVQKGLLDQGLTAHNSQPAEQEMMT